MNQPDPADVAAIVRLYQDYIARTSLVPNLLIAEPNSSLVECNCTSIMGMRVIVNDGARRDFEVAYTL